MSAGHDIVRDDVESIRERVKSWIAAGEIDAIVTTGGTGLTGRDVTPEALEPLFDKRIDGFSVIFHMVSYQTVGLVDPAVAGHGRHHRRRLRLLPAGLERRGTDGWDKVIRWQLDSRHRPCNMVELMPRLLEV